MCELFAATFSKPEPLGDLLREFFARGNEHPHGWGLATKDTAGIELEKEPLNAVESTYLHERLADPVVTATALAHIRYATMGEVKRANCHPFLGADKTDTTWILIHNGTLFDDALIEPYLQQRYGDTDSEGILLALLDATRKVTTTKDAKENRSLRFQILEHLIADISKDNKVNLIFNDGTYTYVHTNFLKQSLFAAPYASGTVFCTEPLKTGAEEPWSQLDLTCLYVYQDGKLIHKSELHNNFYEEKPEDIKYLYQDYAML